MMIWVPGKLITRSLGFLILFGISVGPWPAIDRPYRSSSYYHATIGRLPVFSDHSGPSRLRVGVSQVELNLASPVPLAGFIGQIHQPYEAVNARCFAKALTVLNNTSSVTILAADLLLINDKLAQAVLQRTGLPRSQVFFTATHTHSGPGGWANHPLERLVAGTYDPEVFDLLATRLAEVVVASRTRLVEAEFAFVQTVVSGQQRNRIVPGGTTNDTLSAWVFRSKGSIVATFASFGAHATIAHPSSPRLSGDYPGAVAALLPKLIGSGLVLFAAGTVGDSSPVRPAADNQQKSAAAYGRVLVEALVPAMKAGKFEQDIALQNLGLEGSLPPVEVPFGSAGLRFSPIGTAWIGRRTTYLHTFRIGPALLVGFPGDYAGSLGQTLRSPVPLVATSFNGGYTGYLVSKSTFRAYPSYETRWMSFYGPELGDYLTDLAQRQIEQATQPAR